MGKKMIPLLLAACLMLTACAAAADLCHGRGWCAYVLVVGAGLCPALIVIPCTNYNPARWAGDECFISPGIHPPVPG